MSQLEGIQHQGTDVVAQSLLVSVLTSEETGGTEGGNVGRTVPTTIVGINQRKLVSQS